MASLKCSVCGEGIHYHSTPADVEYRYISLKDWKEICRTKFDKSNKIMDSSGSHPMLFRSDTLDDDFADKIKRFWKCPQCDSWHFFENEKVAKVYKIKEDVKEIQVDKIGLEYVIFDDYMWDELTEKSIPNEMLAEIVPTYYAKIYDNYVVISSNRDYSNNIQVFELVKPDWMN